MKFSDVVWGSDEAKGDENLHKYFFAFPKFEKVEQGLYRYVIGRKGSGKTAVIEKIKQTIEDEPLSFYSTLTLRDFPLADLRSLGDSSYNDKSRFVPIWQFLIYVELSKLLLKDKNIENLDSVQELKEFLSINNFVDDLGFSDTIKQLKSSSSKVNILAKWLGFESNNVNSTEKSTFIHYNKVVNILEKKLKLICSECEFWIFIDELDEGYKAGDSNLRLVLLALLRAVENSALGLRNIKFRPLLVLRSDIFDSLEDNDLNKLDDYVLRLKWSALDKSDTSSFMLKEVVSARIKNSMPTKTWADIVNDIDNTLPERTETVWKYMANRTYERPRDIIKFLKICSEIFENTGKNSQYSPKLSFKDVKAAEHQYSEWLYKELRDEIQAYLPCWKEVFQCLTSIGKGKFSKHELDIALNKNITIKNWLDSNNKTTDNIIEMLFDFGIIGNLDGRRWLFKYKDEDLSWNESMDLIIHFGLHKKFKVNIKNNK